MINQQASGALPAIGYLSKTTFDSFDATEQFNQVHRVHTAAKHEIAYIDGGLNRAHWYTVVNQARTGHVSYFQQYTAIQSVRRSIAALVASQGVK